MSSTLTTRLPSHPNSTQQYRYRRVYAYLSACACIAHGGKIEKRARMKAAITNNYAGENCCRTHAPRQQPPRVGTGVLTNGVPMRRRKRRVFSRFNGPIRTRASISTDARLDRCKISMKNTSRHRTSDFS